MKSYGTMEGVYINGAPQGITLTNVDFRLHQDKMSKLFCAWLALKFHETDNFTLYPASIISINKNRFTKHYFLGDKRVASRIGTGLFNNVYGRNGSYITAGQQDYAERMNQIQTQKEAYYKKVGVAPGVPTEKGAYGDPENTGVGYNAVLTELGNHDVPQGWIQTPRPNTTPGTNPGAPVSWNDPSNPDDPQAGYGYIPNDTTKEETFFYHSDHLGSMSYITDDHANITQYDAYLPYGELLVDEHSSSEDLPYKFNGKQFDEETGLYYYGARYLNPMTSLWYGVDPLAEKYQSIGGYVYCIGNPVKYFDPDGNTPWAAVAEGIGTFVLDAGVDFLSNWILEGQDYKSAFKNVAWGAALLDGATSAAISAFIDGAGASRAIEKIVSSSKGRKVLGIVISVTQGMLTGIASDFETGKIKSFSDIELLPRFLEATLSTLLENKLNKKADELLSYVSSTNTILAQKLKKLERSILNNKNKTRVARDRHKVDIARTNAHKAELKYARSRISTKVKMKAAEQTYKQFRNK